MSTTLKFPSEADVIYEEAQAYQSLNSMDRVLALLDLIASGAALLQNSPHRAEIARQKEQSELEWQEIHKELFHRHGF